MLRQSILVGLGLGVVAGVLGFLLRDLAIDDPFITYRYAASLAQGEGLFYSPGSTTLATTTPLYALLLGLLARVWPNIPLLSNTIGALCLWGGAFALYLLGQSRNQALLGLVAGLVYLLFPLGWLSLGLESAFYLLLVIMAYGLYQGPAGERPMTLVVVGVLLGLATLTRFDAVVPAGILAMHHLWRHRRLPWQPLVAYLVILAPLLIWLQLHYGSPFPATLAAKRAQATLGITGFYRDTTFLQGLVILINGWLSQTRVYLALLFLAWFSLPDRARERAWINLWTWWALAHALVYLLLQVTPYYWYYTSLVPALAWLVARGVVWLAGTLQARFKMAEAGLGGARYSAVLALIIAAPALAPMMASDLAMAQALTAATLPPPSAVVSKVLPEAKVQVYRRVGQWLAVNTPPDALIGVTEVGVIGYYARRPMVDFLGLLDPQVAQALQQGDMGWALAARQPDYVVLTAVNPLYAYDLGQDASFDALYRPLKSFADPRFWGGPVTIYQRIEAPRLDGSQAMRQQVFQETFGGQIELVGARMPLAALQEPLHPGSTLSLALEWVALQQPLADYKVFVHLVGRHDLIVAQSDRLLLPDQGLGGYTAAWQPGSVYGAYEHVVIPVTAYAPDELRIAVGLYRPQDGARLGLATGADRVWLQWPLQLTPGPQDESLARFGGLVALTSYAIEGDRLVPAGSQLALRLDWEALAPIDLDLRAFVHLVNRETGDKVAQDDAIPSDRGLSTLVWQPGTGHASHHNLQLPDGAAPGAYDIWVGLYDATDPGRRLPLLNQVGDPAGDHVKLGPVRVTP